MTTAATLDPLPPFLDEADTRITSTVTASSSDTADDGVEFVVRQHARTDDRTARFFRYPLRAETAILVDFGEATVEIGGEFEPAVQEVIDELRAGDREIFADEVIEMLRNSREADEPDIQLFSLRDMARFLVKHRTFEDPIAGPSPYGIMQVEWHIVGDGLLVMAFVGDGQIHCVAQTDATQQHEAMNDNVRLSEAEALKEYGRLVPLR